MRFADKAPPGFVLYERSEGGVGIFGSLWDAYSYYGIPTVSVPARRPAAFKIYVPAWANDVVRADAGIRSMWKIRLVERAARLVPPADAEFVEEALLVRAMSGDAGVLAWLDERA